MPSSSNNNNLRSLFSSASSSFDSCIAKILQGGTFIWATWFVLLIACIFAQHLHPENNFLSSVVAGAITGIFETLLMFPIENIKTQQQLLIVSSSSSSSSSSASTAGGMSFWQATKRTWRLLGFFGFYRGMAPVLFCAVPNQALRWTAFDTVCTMTDCLGDGRLWAVALSGISSGIVVSLITGVPVETAKTISIHQSMMTVVSSSSSSSTMKIIEKNGGGGDIGEDSDIDVLEGSTIAPVLTPTTTTTTLSTTKSRTSQERATTTTSGDTTVINMAMMSNESGELKKRHAQSNTNNNTSNKSASQQQQSSAFASNNNTLSWEDEIAEASSEECKKNTGPLTWILDLLNNNNNNNGTASSSSSNTNTSSNNSKLDGRGNSSDTDENTATSHHSSTAATGANNKSVLRGWLPTILKKVGNQGIRFPVHRATLDFLCLNFGMIVASSSSHISINNKDNHHHHHNQHSAATCHHHVIFGFLAGATSGIVSIFATQPVDVVKTRMQGLAAEKYGNSLSCAVQLLREEGMQVFFHGMLARALRSSLGAGFAFAFFPIVKDYLMEQQQQADHH